MISVLYKCPVQVGQEQGRGKIQGPGVVLDTAVGTITAPSFKSNISFAFPCHACTRGWNSALCRALNALTGRREGNGALYDLCATQTPCVHEPMTTRKNAQGAGVVLDTAIGTITAPSLKSNNCSPLSFARMHKTTEHRTR